MEQSRSFRIHSFSRRVGRSNSCLLETELAEFGVIPGYQRLSESMRMTGERDAYDYRRRNNRPRVVGFLGRVFSFGKKRRNESEEAKKAAKKRSSWLPDPNRRWPVQGW